MKEKYYIIDAARYPLVLTPDEELPKDVIPLLLKTKDKTSYALGPFLLSEESAKEVDNWFYTEDLYDIVCFTCEDLTINSFAIWCRDMFNVVTDDGHEYFFRYYDSRVLKVFLPTCNEEQVETFFRACSSISTYSEDFTKAIRYSAPQNVLKVEELDIDEENNNLGLKKIKFPLPTVL